ncbi:hypothetical protein GJ744_011995 [Endocarpon pusillum]|uniref:Uncharacterized protein n=1 Tax=Endocarpon pusillum TaxID=364733 RepID=A0A8H7E895_9EURO|nr:hypothetical protein GJ744_011995 [Endocarpon pusillum]
MAFGAALARRSVQVAHATFSNPQNGEHPKMPKIPAWSSGLVLLTVLGFFALFFAVQYSCGFVVGTLTMIESNRTDAYVAVDTLPSNDEDDTMPKPLTSDALLEPEVLLVKNTPITSSIRRTINHLRARYGYLSRFRGLSLFLCLTIARLFIIQFVCFPQFMTNWIGFCFASVLADLILARWEMTWIHVVISEPTQKNWWKRAPAIKNWTKIAPAVALWSMASQIAKVMPIIVGMSFGAFKRMSNPDYQPSRSELHAAAAQSLLVFVLAVAFTVLIQLPATVIVVRVAASMLPEENETVVPFDRSFGGKVTPAILGGQGKIGMVEAWKSFDRSSRIRLVKLMAKILAIMTALWILVVVVVIGEAHLIIGSENIKVIMGALGAVLNKQQ